MGKKTLVLTLCLTLLVITFYYYQKKHEFKLHIEEGDTHQYVINIHSIFEENKKEIKDSDISFTMLGTVKVISKSDKGYVVNIGVERYALWRDRHLVVDSIDSSDFSQKQHNLTALLEAGINQQFDNDGKLIKTEFSGIDKLNKMPQKMVDNLTYTLDQYSSQLNFFPDSFSGKPLEKGQSWLSQSPALKMSSPPQSLRFTISDVSDESIVITSNMEGAESIKGYTRYDTSTGWPDRSVIETIQPMPDLRQGLRQRSTITLRTLEGVPFKADKFYQNRIQVAFQGIPFNLNEDSHQRFFYPPYGAKAPQDVIKQLNESVMWLPQQEKKGKPGLDYPQEKLFENSIYPQRIKSATLINTHNEVMDFQPGINPAFNIYAYDLEENTFSTRTPLLAEKLTAEQQNELQYISLEVESEIIGNIYEGEISKTNSSVSLGDDYTVSVENWSSKNVTLRLSHSGDFDTADWTRLSAEPVDKDGQTIKRFLLKSSHELLDTWFQEETQGKPESKTEYYQKVVSALRLKAPSQRLGDKLFHIETTTPVDHFKLYYAPSKTITHIWKARNMGADSAESMALATRIIPENQIPHVVFEQLTMDDITISGVENNQLTINVPAPTNKRCELTLNGNKSYKGKTLDFEKSYDDTYQLITQNGLTFFYDFNISFDMSCALSIAQKKVDIDNSPLVKRIDKNTIELTNLGRRQLAATRQATILPIDPIGRNAEGQALQQIQSQTNGPDEALLRFRGDVKTLTIPMISNTEKRRYNVTFAPLP